MLDQRVVDGLLALGRIGRQVDEGLGAAIAVLALVVHDAGAHRLVGRVLVGLGQRGVHRQPARVGFLAVLRVHQLAHDLGHVFGVGRELVALVANPQLFVDRLVVLLRRDVAQVAHPLQDVFLPYLGALAVDHRVVGRRCLRQAGQHRRLGHRDVLDRLAEVDARGAGEAVGALAQVDLVHVQLEDLILAQVRLDLVRQHHLVDLAGVGLLAGQEEVARHLHRDGRRALRQAAAQIRQTRAQHADEIDAAMLVEAVVLDRQHGFLHHVGDFGDRHEVAPLLAEFADQHVVGGVDAQRNLRTVVGQRIERRQVRRRDQQRVAEQQGHRDDTRGHQAQRPVAGAYPQRAASRFSRLLLCSSHWVIPSWRCPDYIARVRGSRAGSAVAGASMLLQDVRPKIVAADTSMGARGPSAIAP